jgi:hypothetical protein
MSFAQGALTQPLILQGSNVFLYGTSTSGNAITVQQLSAGNVASFQTSTGATAMMVNPSGYVGIGTTNPGYILDVNGSARVVASTLTLPTVLATTSIGIGTTATPPNKLSVLSTTAQLASAVQISHPVGDWGLVIKRAVNDVGTSNFAFLKSRGEASTIITQGDGIGRIAWHAVTNATGPVIQQLAEINVTNTTFTSGNADGTIIFLTKQTTDAGPIERMRISPSGAVGIGIASPGYTLQVVGTIGASTSFTRTTPSTGVAFNAPGTGMVATDYNYILSGGNDTGTKLVLFVNGSTRTTDGGASNVIIRNDGGSLILGNASFPTIVYGNVGIGTSTNINSPLTVYKASSSSTYTGTTAWGNIHLMPQGTNNSWAGITFGGSSSGTIQQSTQASITVDSNGTTGTNMRFNVGYLFANGALERMTIIGATGNVGIGTYTPGRRLHVYDAATSGSGPFVVDQFAASGFTDTVTLIRGGQAASSSWGACYMQSSSGSNNLFYVRGDGYVWAANDITAFSDARVKTNLQKIERALDKVSNINGYTFTRTDYTSEDDKHKRHVGVIAQEIQKVLPELVHEDDKGMLSVAYGNMTALLIEAIKEERQKREVLEERLTRLEKLLLKE